MFIYVLKRNTGLSFLRRQESIITSCLHRNKLNNWLRSQSIGFALVIIFQFVFLHFTSLSAQELLTAGVYKIEFTDKNQNSYQLSQPDQFLSFRALQRRQRQNIPLKTNDLPVSKFYTDSLQKMGLVVLNTSKWLNAASVHVSDTTLFRKLSTVSFIKPYANSLQVKENRHSDKFNEAYNPITKSAADFYGASYNQINLHHGDYLHGKGFRGQGMLIAVIDAGFNNANNMSGFDSLWLQNRVKLAKDTYNPLADVFAEDSHGAMVLSTMAATKAGSLVGTAPMADYVLLRSEIAITENLIEEFNWSVAAELADSLGADIITSSLGYSQFDNPAMDHTYKDMNGRTTMVSRAAATASSKGMIVVSSAGNEGASSWKYITAPADADSILTVGAVNTSGVRASFSSVGPSFDRRVKPDIVSVGWGAMVQQPNGSIASVNGTSFSAPIIAGLTACLWQSSSGKKNMDIINAIKQSSSQYTNPDSLLGYGIPDFQRAYHLLNPIVRLGGKDIIAWPSPFTDELTIEFTSTTETLVSLEIYNVTGRKVFERQINTNVSDVNLITLTELASFAKGLYIIKIKTNSQTFVCKVIKV